MAVRCRVFSCLVGCCGRSHALQRKVAGRRSTSAQAVVRCPCCLLPRAPRRYRLVKEQPNRPAGEALDYIIMTALNPDAAGGDGSGGPGQPGGGKGLLEGLGATMASMQRFMRSLSQ